MTDIAERLAKEAKQLRGGLARSINQFDSLWLQEAADTIATLRKELAEAVAAHNELVDELRQAHDTYGDMLAEARNKARDIDYFVDERGQAHRQFTVVYREAGSE